MKTVVVEGRGLHSGAHVRVTIARRDGAVTLNGTAISELRVVSKDRATTVGEPRVATVEHLFAALAAFGVRDGLAIDVEGPELPLLDGGAAKWCEVIAAFAIEPRAPTLRILRSGRFEIGRSKYAFEVGIEGEGRPGPSPGVEVEVEIEVEAERRPGPELEKTATWRGDVIDFATRIAPARTFAMAHDVADLASRGLASHVDPESVVVLSPDGALSAGRPFSSDEPARHKLLDLIGDLYLYGGPPLGKIRAFRPGHGATHAAIARALRLGILAR